MKNAIHSLKLHRAITLAGSGPAADGTVALYEYRSLVAKGELEPKPESHLAEGKPIAEIPAGDYLFLQGSARGNLSRPGLDQNRLPDDEARADIRNAAEAVWLEALWREAEFKNDRILVRVLSEDSHTVFQVFRETEREAIGERSRP